MEKVLVQASVLDVVGGNLQIYLRKTLLVNKRNVETKGVKKWTNLFFSLDFDADVKPDGARHGRLVRPLLQIVPNVHFARKGSHL